MGNFLHVSKTHWCPRLSCQLTISMWNLKRDQRDSYLFKMTPILCCCCFFLMKKIFPLLFDRIYCHEIESYFIVHKQYILIVILYTCFVSFKKYRMRNWKRLLLKFDPLTSFVSNSSRNKLANDYIYFFIIYYFDITHHLVFDRTVENNFYATVIINWRTMRKKNEEKNWSLLSKILSFICMQTEFQLFESASNNNIHHDWFVWSQTITIQFRWVCNYKIN